MADRNYTKRGNLFNSDHKATNKAFRNRFDQIKWDSLKGKKQPPKRKKGN